jgi:ribosomal protein S18 acetylase RimI-like enzyme
MIAQAIQHSISYFKRFRMEMNLRESLPSVPALPPGYTWVAWDKWLLEHHAEVKYQCFIEEIDAQVFSSLANRDGCLRLMREITGKPGFRPEATWMIATSDSYCATIQGVIEKAGMGAIQNLGVISPHRGHGLGTALLLKALHGFREAGALRVNLEVTAQNDAAIRIYRRIGFRCRKTLYKAVDSPVPLSIPPNSNEWWD